MLTTDDNNFGATGAIRELLKDNSKMLETQITAESIADLINLCLGRPRNSRFLTLLAELCVCNFKPIISN